MSDNKEFLSVEELLLEIVNPNTGKTLKDEGRIIEIKADANELLFKYKRDGISPLEKKAIQSQIEEAVSTHYALEKITILTVSSDSSDVFKGSASTPAGGHANCSHGDGHGHDHEHGHDHGHDGDHACGHDHKPKNAPAAQVKVGHGPAGNAKKRVAGAKKVIAVSSNKGGVGKSTVAVNLAFSLKNLGKKVGILDADIYGPSVPMLLNKREAKPIASLEKKIIPIDAYGIPFISFGLFVDEKDPVIWRGPMLGGVLNQFLFDVAWEGLDYLIIDLPPGTGDMQLSMVQATDIDGAIVVSTPQDVAILDSRKGLNMFKQVNIPVLGMVENMSYFVPDDAPSKKYFIFGEGGVKKAATELEVNVLAEIPLELALREGSDSGHPYMNEKKYEGRPVWNAYMGLAKSVDHSLNGDGTTDGAVENRDEKGFFKRLFS